MQPLSNSISKIFPSLTVGTVENEAPPAWAMMFQFRLKELGWSVPRLAKEMGRSGDTAFIDRLYKIVKGKVQHPRGRLLGDIAKVLGIRELAREYRYDQFGERIHDRIDMRSEDVAADEPDLRSEDVAAALMTPPLRKTVKLKGYVGAGSEAHFYRIADEDFEEVLAPRNATNKTVAVQIRGKSWGPAMDTWLVFYDDVRSPIDPTMYGKPCILGLSDDRVLLKIPLRKPSGLFRLLSNSDEPPIEDVEIEWAALVTGMAPKT